MSFRKLCSAASSLRAEDLNVIKENLKDMFITSHGGFKLGVTMSSAAVLVNQALTAVQLAVMDKRIVEQLKGK